MRNRRTGTDAVLLAFFIPVAALADAVTVSNHSFEIPAVAPGDFNTSAAPPGWTAVGTIDFVWRAIGVVNPNTTTLYLDPVPHGSNVGVAFLGPTFSNLPSGLHQSLTNTLQPRTVYTLSLLVGNMNLASNPPHNQFDFTGFPGYRVELRAGTNVVASDNNTLLPGDGRFLAATVSLSTASTHANLGQALGIRLLNLDSAAGIEVNFDDVRLDASPRPDPVVNIARETNGTLRVDFTEILSESDDLQSWTPLDPQPASPHTLSPTGSATFYRASD
jgi:hypothetical protein